MKEHLKLLFIAAIMLIVVGGGNASAQTYSGQAYALSATVDVIGNPVVTTAVTDTGDLPNAGGNISLTSVGVNLPGGLVTVGSSNSSTSGGPAPGTISQSAASINNLNVGILGAGITADVVSSTTSCTCPGQVRTGNSVITNLQIGGVPVVIDGTPNQTIVVALSGSRVLTVVIDERILQPRSITVNALHITLEDPLALTTTNIIVASARSGINCTVVPSVNLYSGRGTGVRLREASLLTGDISTIISDTGPLPTSGGDITATTTGAGLAPILSTGVVTSHTEGGLPVNTSESFSQVNDLDIVLGNTLPILPDLLNLTADVVRSDTMCQCSLGIPSCTGDSQLVGLTASVPVLGINIVIPLDFPPNTELIDVNIPLIADLRIVVNEQFSAGPGDITVNALHVELGVLTALLVDTDIVVAHSHSDIECGLGPSAANASISGQVHNGSGRAIPRATVVVTDLQGRVKTSVTNGFGHYRVEDLRAGENYIVHATAKGYEFEPVTVSLTDDLTGIDFTPSSSPSPFKKE